VECDAIHSALKACICRLFWPMHPCTDTPSNTGEEDVEYGVQEIGAEHNAHYRKQITLVTYAIGGYRYTRTDKHKRRQLLAERCSEEVTNGAVRCAIGRQVLTRDTTVIADQVRLGEHSLEPVTAPPRYIGANLHLSGQTIGRDAVSLLVWSAPLREKRCSQRRMCRPPGSSSSLPSMCYSGRVALSVAEEKRRSTRLT